jgi:hypothetical protein
MKRLPNIASIIILAVLLGFVVPWRAAGDKIGVLYNGVFYLDIATIPGVSGNATVTSTSDTTAFVGLFDNATGTQAAKTSSKLTFNASTGELTASAYSTTRGNWAQELLVYEATGQGNNYFAIRPDGNMTANQRILITGAPPTAGQFFKILSVSGDNATAQWYSMTEKLGATFDGGGAPIVVNTVVYDRIPYACTVNTWTVICDQDSGTTGIIITPYKDTYAEDTLPTTTMCATGTAPHTTDGAGAGGTMHSSAWDCNVTTLAVGDAIAYKVTTAPTAATRCTLTLKVTRN